VDPKEILVTGGTGSLVAYLAYAVPHFVFHLTKGHAFSLGNNLANMVTLGIAVLLPLVLLAASRGGEEASRDRVRWRGGR
jgi:hypothetical protein